MTRDGELSPLGRLVRHFPPAQVLRYLLVGAWNTLFGYGLFAALTYLLTGVVPYAYMAASALSNVGAITVAFFGYKWFVFRTKGNYLREYLRCYMVYGTAMLVSLALLPILMILLQRVVRLHGSAPYVAGAMLAVGTVLISFVGHKRFSFAAKGGAERTL